MTDKCGDRVGHLNTVLARGGGNLNDQIFKSSNARALPWELVEGTNKKGENQQVTLYCAVCEA